MNEIFERHAERLSSGERREIWEAIAAPRAMPQRPSPRVAWLGAAVAVTIVAIAALQLRPIAVTPTAAVVPPGAISAKERPAVDRNRALPGSEHDGAKNAKAAANAKAAPPVASVAAPSARGDARPMLVVKSMEEISVHAERRLGSTSTTNSSARTSA